MTLSVRVACVVSEDDAKLMEEMRVATGIRTPAAFARMLILRSLNELSSNPKKVSDFRAMYRAANIDLVAIYRKALETMFHNVPIELETLDVEERGKEYF